MPTILELQETDYSRNQAKSLSKINPALGAVNSELIRPTEYFVGLYSVNRRRMADSPHAFVVENGAFKTVCIPPCPVGKRYIKVMDIAHPVQSIEADPNAPGETIVRVVSAKRVAMAIVHPDVIGESMDHLPPRSALAMASISSNCDLIRQGVFFTTEAEGSPKFEKALRAAEERLEAFYRSSLDGLMGMGEDEVRRVLSSEKGLDLRTAAEHFGEEYSWLRQRAPKINCPNCFEKIPSGAAFHKNELLGVICVLDWKRAVDAGVKTRDQVPAGRKWWVESPSRPADYPPMEEVEVDPFGAHESDEDEVDGGDVDDVDALPKPARGKAGRPVKAK